MPTMRLMRVLQFAQRLRFAAKKKAVPVREPP
jgi:hypothetical protein